MAPIGYTSIQWSQGSECSSSDREIGKWKMEIIIRKKINEEDINNLKEREKEKTEVTGCPVSR